MSVDVSKTNYGVILGPDNISVSKLNFCVVIGPPDGIVVTKMVYGVIIDTLTPEAAGGRRRQIVNC